MLQCKLKILIIYGEEISFTGSSQNCCVSFIDIVVDSTRITTTEINEAEKIRRYYSIFINTMAAIIRDFNANIIKNTGDSLLYYFPETSNNSADDISVFKEVFECGLTIIAPDYHRILIILFLFFYGSFLSIYYRYVCELYYDRRRRGRPTWILEKSNRLLACYVVIISGSNSSCGFAVNCSTITFTSLKI